MPKSHDQSSQGSLVSIVDEYEQNLARSLLYPEFDVFNGHGDGQSERPAFWIGLTAYKATQDNGWIGQGDIIYAWNDKFPFSATYWSANQPNEKNIVSEPSKTCFFMNLPSGQWANSAATTCASQLPRLCKINVGKSLKIPCFALISAKIAYCSLGIPKILDLPAVVT